MTHPALDRGISLQVMIGAFAFTILGFFVRGFSQIVVSPSTAERLAVPFFLLAILCAGLGFVLAVSITLADLIRS